MGTLNNYLIKPAIMAGLAAMLSSCPRAQAESQKDYSFYTIGTEIKLDPDLPALSVNSVYAADLDNDGKLDIIAGTNDGRIFIYKNKTKGK